MLGQVIVIDGHNLLLRIVHLKRGQRVKGVGIFRLPLACLIASKYPDTEVLLVFDGICLAKTPKRRPGRTKQIGKLNIHYSTPPQSADDLILQLCEQRSGQVIVVTSDRELIKRTRPFTRGKHFTTEQFAQTLRGEELNQILTQIMQLPCEPREEPTEIIL